MAEALEILWSPIRFMRARCKEDIKIALPFVIFVSALIITVVDMAIMYGRVMDRMPTRIQEQMGTANLGFGVSLVAFGLNMFLFWVLGSGILACLAILLDGEGEYRRVLELSGLAHMPVLIFAILGLVIALTYKPTANFERLFVNRDLKGMTHAQKKELEEGLRKEINRETSSTTFKLIHSLRYTFTCWTLVLCVLATRFAFNLSTGKAAISVSGLVVLYVVLEIARARLMSG